MRIALLGDIGLFGRFDLMSNDYVYEYLSEVADLLSDFDYVVGNLETPFTKKTRTFVPKSAHLRTDPVNVKLLKYLKINSVNLANNHIFDFGRTALKTTLNILGQNNINYFGINGNQLLLKEPKIAFSGFCCYSTNAYGYLTSRRKTGVNVLDSNSFKKSLMRNDEKGFINVTSVHFGDEHIHYPRIEHVKLARDVADSIPYVFYGHHPHVIQGIENHSGALIAYSLGNFCFDDVYTGKSKLPKIKRNQANKESFILSVDIRDQGIFGYEAIPIMDTDSGIVVNPNQSDIFEQLEEYSGFLSLDQANYTQQRKQMIRNLGVHRISNRNLGWYLQRLNLNMLGTKVKGRINRKKYQYHLREFL